MCCEGRNAKDAFVPTGTWLDRTSQDTFTADDVARADGCDSRTVERAVDRGEYGSLPYWQAGAVRIPRWAVIHYHDRTRRERKAHQR